MSIKPKSCYSKVIRNKASKNERAKPKIAMWSWKKSDKTKVTKYERWNIDEKETTST